MFSFLSFLFCGSVFPFCFFSFAPFFFFFFAVVFCASRPPYQADQKALERTFNMESARHEARHNCGKKSDLIKNGETNDQLSSSAPYPFKVNLQQIFQSQENVQVVALGDHR